MAVAIGAGVVVLVVCVIAAGVALFSGDGGGSSKTAGTTTPTTGTVATTTSPATTTTTAPAAPAVPFRAYGILWSAVFGTQPVQSYGLPTANAPTSAVNPAIYAHPHGGVRSFQVQQ